MERFYPGEDSHGIDNSVDPDGLDWGKVLALDLVLDVVDVTLVDQFFPQDLGLELFLLTVIEVF